MNWQPIEIAPKDGTKILGFNSDSRMCESVYWNQGDNWVSSNYYNDTSDDPTGYDLNITHWMPLPEPPKDEK